MSDSDLKVILGSKSIIEYLEDLIERVKNGEADAVATIELSTDGGCAVGVSWNGNCEYKYSRILGGISQLQYDILSGAITFGVK